MSGLRDTDGRQNAEDTLAEREEIYQAVVEQIAEAIWIFDADTKQVLESNATFRELLGYTVEDLAGMTNYDFVAHDRESVDRTVGRMAEGGRGAAQEREYRRKDGTLIPVEVNGARVPYRGGEAVCAVARDLTGRRRAEGALRESERRFRTLVQNASDVVTLLRADGTIIYDSPAIEKVLGYGAQERIGQSAFGYIHEDDVERARATFGDALRAGGAEPAVAFRVRHKNGAWRHVEVTRANLLEDPTVGAIVANTRDVTEREEAYRALEKSEARFRSVVQNSSEIIKIVGPDGTLKYASPAFGRLLGHDPEASVGMNVLDHVHPGDLPRILAETEEAMATGGTARNISEYRYRHADGFWRHLEASGVYLLDDPAVKGVVVNARDVTQRKEAEAGLREAEEKFRSIFENAAVGIFRTTPDGRYVDANPAAARLLGYPSPEALVAEVTDIGRQIYVDPAQRDEFVRSVEEDGSVAEIETRMYRRDGSVAWVSESARAVRGADGALLYYEGFTEDITQRKEAEEALREAEEKYRSIFEGAAEGIYQTTPEGGFIDVNPAMARLFGYESPAEMISLVTDIGRQMYADAGRREQFVALAQENDLVTEFESRIRRKDGSVAWVSENARAVRGADGVLLYYEGFFEDITQRKEAEEALRESEEFHRAVIERSVEAIYLFDPHTKEVLETNAAFEQLTGYAGAQLLGMRVYDLLAHDRENVDLHVERHLMQEGHFVGERRYRCKDGRIVDVAASATLVPRRGAEVVCVVVRDISERKTLEEQLRHQALHDSLTGLPNRVLLLDRLEQALARADRSGEPVSALFVDLDNFKKLNDSLGHEAGNVVLGKVAERLGGCVRPGDTVARLFGDEFAVLLESPAGADDARRVAERIMEVLGRPIGFDGQEVFTGCSIGIAMNDTGGDRPADILRRADLAMYAAKGRGKDSYEVYNPSMNTRALRRMELENDLRRAVEREEFEVHYQPIFRTSTGEVARVEALARWRHPGRGWIDPEDFIGLAEQTGLVRPLGRLVLEAACRQAKAWRERFPSKDLKVSVNFSASQFDRQVDAVPMTLSEVGLSPEALQLEITERAVMSNAEFALGKLQRLRDLGVGFAIDDYGTGYSCLYYLKRMPVNCLKIDRTFVSGLGRDRGDTAIVSGTIDLAHALGLEVVAEGVETADQLEKLRDFGCDMAQGFFLSVPLPAGEVPALLARRPPALPWRALP